MSNSFEKSVKGGTKVKLAPPKSKYVEHILVATQSGDAGVAEVFRTLTHRLRDSTWTVAFKSLIIVHLMIREGSLDVTLRYLSQAPQHRLAINHFTDVQTQGHNIRTYAEYLLVRAVGFDKTRCDYVRSGEGRMKRLTVDKGLLRETEVVQEQIKALVKCNLLDNDVENEISLTAFRLLTRDLLDLYKVVNEAVMAVLSRYFEMSRPDAERAIRIYRKFCSQTDLVVQYLSVARRFETATRLEIPKLRHAPTSLAASLQEYLNDPDFEVNRRQYLAEQEAKKFGKPVTKTPLPKAQPTSSKTATPFDEMPRAQQAAAAPAAPAKGPAPDLIDFFEAIESNQQTMDTNPFLQQQQQFQQSAAGQQAPQQSYGFQQPHPQQSNAFMANSAQTNPFDASQMQQQMSTQPLQMQPTGAGFGGYGPQPPQQQQFLAGPAFSPEPQSYASPVQQQPAAPLQPQSTNPFRQSMMATGSSSSFSNAFGQSAPQLPPDRQGSNPFARSVFSQPIPEEGPIQQQQPPPPPSQQSPFSQPAPFQAQPLQAQATGTNPFARTPQPSTAPSPAPLLLVQPTGSTNPFRQSQFVNQQTGQGWQHGPQGKMGGLENLETIAVFPRPGQAGGQQPPQQQQSPWM